MEQEKDLSDSLEEVFQRLKKMNTISPEDIPTMDLYMDQLTSFMDSRLRPLLRNPKVDKVLTKTMINNYAKNDLIPSPVKKKYTKDHLFELLFIFYFKSFLSIGDIQTLLGPLSSDFFDRDGEDQNGYDMERIYSEIRDMGRGARQKVKEDTTKGLKLVEESFADAPEEYREYLKRFAYICQLGYDIFLKKSIIEHLIDDMQRDMDGEE